MAENEGDFPTTDDNLAASTKRLADWTFSLQGVGADLKQLMNEFKTYWRGLMPATAEGTIMAALIPESKETAHSISMRQGIQRQSIRFALPKASRETAVIIVLFVLLIVSLTINALDYARNARNDVMLKQAIDGRADAERAAATELALRRYNLDWFRSHEFAELEVKVGVLEKTCRR